MAAITLRAGLGRNLTAAEADGNVTALNNALIALEVAQPLPIGIESVQLVDTELSFTLDDGTVLGPLTIKIPAPRWRREWAPFTDYAATDIFTVAGLGVYMVLLGHTGGASFDAALLVGGQPAIQQLFGMTTSVGDTIYDLAFFYQDLLSASVSDRLAELVAPRAFILPTVGSHQAKLRAAPSTSVQVIPIYQDAVQIGHIDFAVGDPVGTVTITADTTFAMGDSLEVGLAPLLDPAARGLALTLAAQRVL